MDPRNFIDRNIEYSPNNLSPHLPTNQRCDMASLPIKLIQPKDAIGKTVKGVLHQTGFLTFVFLDGTYVHIKAEMEWGVSPILETKLTMDTSDCTHHELTSLGLTDLAEAVRAEEIRRREAFQAHTEKREREEYERLKAKFHAT